MAFTPFYLDSGTFSPQKFRSSFKDGVGVPSLFTFQLKRYPEIFFKPKESTQSLGGMLGGNLEGVSKLLGLNNISVPSDISNLMNISETLYSTFTGRGIDDLKFKINSVQLPEKILQTYSTRTYGPIRDFPSEIESSAIGMNVLCGGAYTEHEFFSAWIDGIGGHDRMQNDPLFNIAYYDDIITEGELTIYDEDGYPSYVCYLDDIYPKSVGGINLNWSAKDQISQFNIVLNFRVMKTEKIASSTKSNSGILEAINKFDTLKNIF